MINHSKMLICCSINISYYFSIENCCDAYSFGNHEPIVSQYYLMSRAAFISNKILTLKFFNNLNINVCTLLTSSLLTEPKLLNGSVALCDNIININIYSATSTWTQREAVSLFWGVFFVMNWLIQFTKLVWITLIQLSNLTQWLNDHVWCNSRH